MSDTVIDPRDVLDDYPVDPPVDPAACEPRFHAQGWRWVWCSLEGGATTADEDLEACGAVRLPITDPITAARRWGEDRRLELARSLDDNAPLKVFVRSRHATVAVLAHVDLSVDYGVMGDSIPGQEVLVNGLTQAEVNAAAAVNQDLQAARKATRKAAQAAEQAAETAEG